MSPLYLVAVLRASHTYLTPPSQETRVHDLESGRVGKELEGDRNAARSRVFADLVWENTGDSLVGLEPMTGRSVRKIPFRRSSALLDVPSPKGDRLITMNADGALLVLDLEGAVIARVEP